MKSASAPELRLQNLKPILTSKANSSERGRSHWSQGEPPRFQTARRDIERPPRTHPLSLPMNRPLTRPSATLSPSDGEREGVRGRFMESPLSFFRMHWDHERDWHPSPCPLPARRGEGGRRPGEGRFMERPPEMKIRASKPLNRGKT